MDQQSPRKKAGRELLAGAAVSLVGLAYLGTIWQTGAPSLTTGRVVSFGLVEQKGYGQVGSIVRAVVVTADGRTVSIPLSDGSLCRVGSQIEVEESHTLFGSRFAAGLHDCSASALNHAKLKAA